MDDATTVRLVPTKSAEQAREWRLALTSQGIPSSLTELPGTGDPAIAIDAEHAAFALQTLRQYQIENRGWGWRQPTSLVPAGIHPGVIGWVTVMFLFYTMSTAPGSALKEQGLLSRGVQTADEYWRLLTATSLHADPAHLALNLVSGVLLVGLTLGRFGYGLGTAFVLLAGVLGNIFGLAMHPEPGYRSLGASGVVLAALGMLTAAAVREGIRQRPRWKPVFASLGAGILLFVLNGTSPDSDVVVHLGGFLGGLLTGAIADAINTRWPRARLLQPAALFIATVSFLAAWWFATRS